MTEEAERITDRYRQDDDGSMDDIDATDVVDIINEWMQQYDETGAA